MKSYDEESWFYPLPVGHDPLDTFMKKLSIKLELSDHYTNHCIRATCMQTLDDAGLKACHIISLSSHKSESTVKKYATKCPEQKKCQMSEALNEKLHKKKKGMETPPPPPPEAPEPFNSHFDLLEFDAEDNKLLEKFLNANQEILDNSENILPQPEETALVPCPDKQSAAIPVQGTSTPHPPEQQMQQNIQQNIASRFSMPVIPKMYFPGSNIISYNFEK